MSKRIVRHWGKPAVEVKGSGWATVGAILLVIPATLAGYVVWFYDASPVALVSFVALVAGVVWLLSRGRRRRTVITAMLDARTVPGGTHMVVLDARGDRHEFVVAEDVARGLANVLNERALAR